MKIYPLIILFCCFINNALAEDGHYTQFVGASGVIDWTKASVEAIGYGVAPAGKNPKVAPLLACRAAIVDAQRNLLESFQGVRVTSTTLVSNYSLTSDIVKSSVEGTVQGALIKSRVNRADGSCKVMLQAPLKGKISKSIYTDLHKKVNSAFNLKDLFSSFISSAHASQVNDYSKELENKINKLTKRITDIEALLNNKVKLNNKQTVSEITGIVIDVRGSNFIPSLDPKIRASSGDVLYPNKENVSAIIDSGQLVSLFASQVDFAMDHPIVGNTPLLIKANKTWDKNNTEITVNNLDSQKLIYLTKNKNLKNTGVIIVLD